ncbi:hypothetical protein INT47_003594 [Mucor saturninus]|uniref:Uncharacterized protein n=1 Tax=Mucor saturninus TaxID=64648 RepID=A0A8H7QR13_9FUNG|nr:hypothetical protein INT47_003594 [Mucor saturninus]
MFLMEFGRKIDIIAKSRFDDVNLDLSSIEFKAQGADDTTFMKQQSKNIRTNICILNNITSRDASMVNMLGDEVMLGNGA